MDDLAGQEFRGYRLVERIGAGGFGAVYRAEQFAIGRDVAIKVILPEYASDAEFNRRFEIEARTVAQLEHPHIVPLYDYWRDENGAFLVMRLLSGGNLREALEKGAWELEAVADLLDQIAAALGVAHANGVVHRDLKPENILLDEQRNAYLTDFGIAKDLGGRGLTKTGMVIGSVDYLAPEQAKAEPVTPQTDLYGLGVILYELLTGTHPFGELTAVQMIQKHLHEPLPSIRPQRPDLPADLDRVIQLATAKDPSGRYENVVAIVQDFERVLVGKKALLARPKDARADAETLQVAAGETAAQNPYRGLAAFREADAPLFFGRESFTDRVIEAVGKPPNLAAIVGSSGSGKSSVVFAGLFPRMRERGSWLIADLRPGSQPVDSLTRSLLPMLDPSLSETDFLIEARKLAQALRAGDLGLTDLVERAVEKADAADRLLLAIDQFEELYTLCREASERRRFLEILLDSIGAAKKRAKSDLDLVLTLRADFMGQALRFRPFADVLQDATFILGPMTRDELGEAIAKPAAKQGVKLSPGLLDRLLDDVGEEPGNLPLLEFALTLAWERQAAGRLSHTSYDEIGRVDGALTRYADEVFKQLAASEQKHARYVFMQMVRPGEGTEDTRRLASRGELGDGHWELVQRLADQRLIVTGQDAAGNEVAEVVHEALIRRWNRLRDWIESDRSFRSWQERLRATIRRWQESELDEGVLLRGAPLAEAQEWLNARGSDLSVVEHDFIQASVDLQDKRAAEREEQRQRELDAALEKARAADRLRKGRRYLAGALAAALALAAAAFFFGNRARLVSEENLNIASTAVAARRIAEAQSQVALARELASHSVETYEADPVLSLLLAVEAVKITREMAPSVAFEAELALYRALTLPSYRGSLRGHAGPVNMAIFSPDGTRIVTASDDGTARLWNSYGDFIASLEGHSDLIHSARFSPDGSRIVTASRDGTARLWDAEGNPLATLEGHTSLVWDADFSPDGSYIVTASNDGTARLWDAEGGFITALVGHAPGFAAGFGVISVSFNSESNRILTASQDGTARIWDLQGNTLAVLEGHVDKLSSASFSPDGSLILTSGLDLRSRLWDSEGTLLHVLEGHTGWIQSATFSPDGSRIVSVSEDRSAILWDTDGNRLNTLLGHTNTPLMAAYSPDGERILTASLDGTARLWDAGGEFLRAFGGHTGGVNSARFSPNGARILTASEDGSARLWDADGNHILVFAGHSDWVNAAAFSPDGTRIVTVSDDATARMWDVFGRLISLLEGPDSSVLSVGIGPDGSRIVGTTHSGEVYLWEADGALLSILRGHAGRVVAVSFRPDGSEFVTASEDGTARVWSRDGDPIAVLEGHTERMTAAEYSPDGEHIVTAAEDGTARIWMADGPLRSVLQGHTGAINAVSFSADGTRILTAGADNTARVWDATGNLLLVLEGHERNVSAAAFSPDGKRMVTASSDGTARVWGEDGSEVAVLEGHSGDVVLAAFTPDGSRIVTASTDGTARLWDADGRFIIVFEGHADEIRSLDFSPDGRLLLTASNDHTARMWEILGDIDSMVAEAERRAGRGLSERECQKYMHLAQCAPLSP